MIKRAEVTLELELLIDIDYAACTDKKQGCVGFNQGSRHDTISIFKIYSSVAMPWAGIPKPISFFKVASRQCCDS